MPLDPNLLKWVDDAFTVVGATAFVVCSLDLFKVVVNDLNHDVKALRETSAKTLECLERLERKFDK